MSTPEVPKTKPKVPKIGFAPASQRPTAEINIRPGEEWRSKRACNGLDPAIFYVTSKNKEEQNTADQRAKDICATCPVQQPCLENALTNRQNVGAIGGMTEKERRDILKRRGF